MILKVTTEPDGSTYYENDGCAMRISNLTPHVTFHTMHGIATRELSKPIAADVRRTLLFHKRCVALVDAYDLEVMRYELRSELIATLRACRGRDLKVCVLVRTRLVEMAASLGNLLTGDSFVNIYWDIAEWEQVGQREVSGFRRRPIARRRPTR